MDLYILKRQLSREKLVDYYQSLIWTERFNELGDFEMVIESTEQNKTDFILYQKLSIGLSERIMVVTRVEENIDADGKMMLHIKGQSLERILKERVARYSSAALSAGEYWSISGKPASVARTMFRHICIDGALDSRDKIPYIQGTYLGDSGSIAEPEDVEEFLFPLGSLYDTIKEICDTYNLGFSLTNRFDIEGSLLYFTVYTGKDRTTSQSTNAPVIFADSLDTIKETSQYISVEERFDTAYVFSINGFATAYEPGATTTNAGFSRHIMFVKSENTKPAGSALTKNLQLEGRQALAKQRAINAYDGIVPQIGSYVYGSDYDLGDIVEFQAPNGEKQPMRVVEQIFSYDENGFNSYPSFATGSYFPEEGDYVIN